MKRGNVKGACEWKNIKVNLKRKCGGIHLENE